MEVSDYNKNEEIDMATLPQSIKEEMGKVAKIEKCDIRELRYERSIFYSPEDMKWIDSAVIIYPTKDN